LIIALVVGVIITAAASVLTATFQESSQAFGGGRVLMGVEAASAAIKAFGFWGYVKGLAGTFVLFFVSIFIGALWQGVWTSRRGPVNS
jgi:hypothetical protein